ncbi:hypothetical protein AB0M28_29715 [Streptomyces sp. NPDC051940]|uniref:hypothetical protein n=1 Tax=Streptomyces sp. NPDC051940 TaxID=3155675 RepID=UPI003414F06F
MELTYEGLAEAAARQPAHRGRVLAPAQPVEAQFTPGPWYRVRALRQEASLLEAAGAVLLLIAVVPGAVLVARGSGIGAAAGVGALGFFLGLGLWVDFRRGIPRLQSYADAVSGGARCEVRYVALQEPRAFRAWLVLFPPPGAPDPAPLAAVPIGDSPQPAPYGPAELRGDLPAAVPVIGNRAWWPKEDAVTDAAGIRETVGRVLG